MSEFVNPFHEPSAPYPGALVLYRHDMGIWPAIVSEVRLVDRERMFWPDTTPEVHLREVLAKFSPVYVEAHLTLLRPGQISWPWATQGPGARQWYWPPEHLIVKEAA